MFLKCMNVEPLLTLTFTFFTYPSVADEENVSNNRNSQTDY